MANKNQLRTEFVFEDKQFSKVDSLHKKLLDVNNAFNNLGGSVVFGNTVDQNAQKAGDSVDKLKKKVEDFKTGAEKQDFTSTISRHWENEAAAVEKSAKRIETTVDGLSKKSYTPGQPTGFKIDPKTPVSAGVAAPSIDIYKLQKSAEETRKALDGIAKTRIDGGQINNLSRELVTARDRSRQLGSDIANIKKELANPNRKSSIAFLTDELRAAEKEADALNRKLSTLSGTGGSGRSADLRLSSFQKTNLSYQVNDIATMAAMGANPTQILASQGGQIAQIFSAEQISAFAAAYSGLLPILGAGTAAIALTYKVTGDVRAQAEQRLKTEEKIAATLNKQRLEAHEIKKSFEAQRKEAAFDRQLQSYQQSAPIEQIRGRKELLDRLLVLAPASDRVAEYRKELLALEAQIASFDQKQKTDRLSSPDAAFDLRKSDFKKNEEAERLSIEKARVEAAEKFRKSVEQGREKVKELGKTFTDTFDNLFQKTGANNPFAAVFSEADKSLKSLRENIKGLTPELQAAALAMQNNLNANALFSARLDNALNAFDLRDGAANFRDFREMPFEIKDPKQFFKDFTEFYSNEIEKRTGGSFLGYSKNGTFGGTTSFDLRDGLNFAFDKLAGGGSIRREKTYADLTESEKQKYLSSVNQVDESKNLSLQNRLDKQFAIINSLGAANPEQIALANRKIISLMQGVDPSQLTTSQREQAALAREREAVRLENAEREAKDQRQKQIELQTRIADNQEKLLKIAEEKGLDGLNNFLEIQVKDETSGGVKVLGASPKPADMVGNLFNFGN